MRKSNHIRSLSENRNRHEGKLGLGRFLAVLKRIAQLFDEKQLKMAQIQFFCNRFSILGQAPGIACNPNPDIENKMGAQALNAPKKSSKSLITNEVCPVLDDSLCTSTTCTLKLVSISGLGYNILVNSQEGLLS